MIKKSITILLLCFFFCIYANSAISINQLKYPLHVLDATNNIEDDIRLRINFKYNKADQNAPESYSFPQLIPPHGNTVTQSPETAFVPILGVDTLDVMIQLIKGSGEVVANCIKTFKSPYPQYYVSEFKITVLAYEAKCDGIEVMWSTKPARHTSIIKLVNNSTGTLEAEVFYIGYKEPSGKRVSVSGGRQVIEAHKPPFKLEAKGFPLGKYGILSGIEVEYYVPELRRCGSGATEVIRSHLYGARKSEFTFELKNITYCHQTNKYDEDRLKLYPY